MPAAYLKGPALPMWVGKRQCSKIRFDNRRDALNALRGTNKQHGLTEHGDGRLTTYRCPSCCAWHVGHAIPNTMRREWRQNAEAA